LQPGNPVGLIYPIAAALVVYGCLMSVPVAKFLQQTRCLFLGRISFGLYLIHVPIAYTVVMAVAVLLWPMSAIILGLGLLIFIALSIGLAWLMTVLVDGPTLRLLASIRALEKKWRSPIATVGVITAENASMMPSPGAGTLTQQRGT
jgi:peptidoglycan/LPS O-acetylase OafA/YrhL